MTETSISASEGPAIDRDGVPHYRLWIGGRWVDSAESIDVIDPATEGVVCTVARADPSHADAAVAAAKAVHEGGVWRGMAPLERVAVFERAAGVLAARMDELTLLGSRETGMPLRVAGAIGVGFPLVHLQHYIEQGRNYVWEKPTPIGGQVLHAGIQRKEPLGVCVGIVPWNFPALIAVWKAVPALIAGNTVVLKTDEQTPIFALEFAAVLAEAGLPAGALNVVVGDGPNVGGRLVKHPDVRLVSFTGSTATGRQVMADASGNVKRVLLELGGKGPNIVLDDADLDAAVDGSIYAFLLHAGQACESGTRLLLPSSLHDEFVERLKARIATLKIGDPQDPSTDIGAVMSRTQQERILGYIEKGREAGATVVVGGGVPQGEEYEKGFWVEPTVFVDVEPHHCIAREEIFGPVLSVLKYDSIDEAVAIANDSEYGLAGAVWGRDVDRALSVANRIETGSVWINDYHNIDAHLPFGGAKQSGIGHELGEDTLNEFLQSKSITVDLSGDVAKRAYGLVLGTPPNA
ncbi:MAG: aldehyde dehydrogenase family protein [Gordonia sp. (in: high G+C Gram-positive bacteria)]|uniref:aldehyde dehydrogenase family protein n=1 Tax=Gordonia sp. (in: high G+C Gram-positive bacteria) TaxID=84139 RepID=UPI0039E71E0F